MSTAANVEKEEVKPQRTMLSQQFGGAVSRRISFDEKEASRNATVAAGNSKSAVEQKAVRRRKSLDFLVASQLDGGTGGLLKDAICSAYGITSEMGAKEKMDILLIQSKRKGVTAEKLFTYFDQDKDENISAHELKNGLITLDPVLFQLADEDIVKLVETFDTDGDGSIQVSEFESYCLELPDPAWRAEKLRRMEIKKQEEDRVQAEEVAQQAALDLKKQKEEAEEAQAKRRGSNNNPKQRFLSSTQSAQQKSIPKREGSHPKLSRRSSSDKSNKIRRQSNEFNTDSEKPQRRNSRPSQRMQSTGSQILSGSNPKPSTKPKQDTATSKDPNNTTPTPSRRSSASVQPKPS